MLKIRNFLSFLTQKLEPKEGLHKKFDTNLEGLRGFAALAVMFSHGLARSNALETKWKLPEAIPYFSVGALAVLLFFMLSGYVIGLTTLNSPKLNVALFYKKRLIRLYPIYLLSFSALFILGTKNSFFQTLGNLVMLQKDNNYWSISIPVETNLSPIWSINYEIIYYLIFPVIFIRKPKISLIIGTLILISLVGYYTTIFPLFLSDYAIGYFFWICGLIISWYFPNNNIKKFRFLSYIFLIMTWSHFSIGKIILKGFHLFDAREHGLSLDVLLYIPVCIMVICDISQRSLPYKKGYVLYSFLLPLLLILYLFSVDRLFESIRWTISTVFYFISLLFFYEKKASTIVLKKLNFLGGISYGIYLFHWPLMIIIGKYYPYQGTVIAYLQKFSLWIILTLVFSYIAERIIQPQIKSYFLNNKKIRKIGLTINTESFTR